MRDPYQAHADFIKPAWVFADPWRVGAVLIGFELAFIATPELIYYLLPFSVYNAVYNVSETALGTTLEFLSFGVTLALFVILVRGADLTARTGNLGAAIGLHTANNMFAATLVGIEGWPSSGLARHLYAYIDPSIYDYSLGTLLQPWAVLEVFISALGVAVMWLAARLAMRR